MIILSLKPKSRYKMAIKRDAADKWFSDVVRQNAGFECEHCHRQDGSMECAHIFGRAAKSVRWSMMNAVCLCHYCHLTFTANPLDFTAWLEQYKGQGTSGYTAGEVAGPDED